MSDAQLRRLIADAQSEIDYRSRDRLGSGAGQRAIVADLAERPVSGFDLGTLRTLYHLDFTSELTVSGLVYGSFSEAHSASGWNKPLKTLGSALRIRTLLTIPGLRIPWQMRESEFPDFVTFIADVMGVAPTAVDWQFLAKLSGRVNAVTQRWLRDPQRYPVVGPTARWFAFVQWVLESHAPSERAAVLDQILELVALELSVRARAGAETVADEITESDDTKAEAVVPSAGGKRKRRTKATEAGR